MLLVGWLSAIASSAAEEYRTWTDSTGKYKIKAKFVQEEAGTVTLRQEDGEELEIELKNLSAADQKVIAELKKTATENPFRSKAADPFKPKGKTSTRASTTPTRESETPASQEFRQIRVDWHTAETIGVTPVLDEWKVEVLEAGDSPLSIRPKNVTLPAKSNFFEGLKGLALNPAAKKAVVGYLLADPRPQGVTRLVICDLETGRASSPASLPGQMLPLALHDDGKHVLMRREEFGFGNHDRLELWALQGSRVQRLAAWVPYDDQRGGDRDIQWGAFLNAEMFVTSGGGEIVIWKFPEIQPLYRLACPGGGRPALSPDRKLLAFCDGKSLGLLDVEKHEILCQQATPASLHAPMLAFSPSGRRLACISQQLLLVWDVTNGGLIQNFPISGVHIFTGLDFPHDNYVLGGNKYLIDIQNQLKLWTYDGHEQVATMGGWTFFAVADGQKSAALLPVRIPHPGATELLQKALTDPNLFVLKAGTKVKLDVSAIPDPAQREKVIQGLSRRLQAIECTADPQGTITLVAALEGPKQREISFIASGDYKMQEYLSKVSFVYDGKPIWESASTNVPFIVHLKRGENIESHLRSLEKPDYAFFERVELPKFLQKPSSGSGPSSSLTLGTSRITPAGIR